jgi:hypothetical protein
VKIIRRSSAARLTQSAGRFVPESRNGQFREPADICLKSSQPQAKRPVLLSIPAECGRPFMDSARAKPRAHRSACSRTGCDSSG